MLHTVTQTQAERLIHVINAGLVKGKGEAVLGNMCLESAISYATGEPFSDSPKCVSKTVKRVSICLNDSQWENDKQRSRCLLKLGVAQLGSVNIDQRAFSKLFISKLETKFIPLILNEQAAKKLRAKLAYAAADAADAAYTADAYANADAYAANADANANADAYAAYTADAAYIAYAAAASAAYGYGYGYNKKYYDLKQAIINLAVETLIELKSPGCKYLFLCEDSAS